ncbi:MAG: hypothetical protein JO354_03065 [Verrucomicrobia bacterium]|nr:hypothetical protein [Verrucomicrobiota bacterium]
MADIVKLHRFEREDWAAISTDVAQVKLDPEVHTIVWPTGADFDPAMLRDWEEHEAVFQAAAKHGVSKRQQPE